MEARAADTDVAGVVMRPPRLFLAAILLGLAADRGLPISHGVHAGRVDHLIGGGALMALGIALMVAAIRGFRRAGTPVPTVEPTTALVTTGPHGWSRNPIYLGMYLIYAGIGVMAASTGMLMLLLPLIVIMRYGVVAREEAYLERRFGDAYRNYTSRVRRWL
jgi:protein-S-isoprenylcysteine O-methyltransferase Ste14